MSWPRIVERINAGEVVEIRPSGNSMTPRIRSKDLVRLEAVDRDQLVLEDVVLAKVKGRYWLHKITAIDGDRIQISNNHGHVNGWTNRTKVYAIVTSIER